MLNNSVVNNDLDLIYKRNRELFKALAGKTILVTGATGLIGSFFIKSILYVNQQGAFDIKIVALVRNENKAKLLFGTSAQEEDLRLLVQEITSPVVCDEQIDYVVHAASNTASKSFVEYPVETLDIAIEGTKHILNLARAKQVKSIVYLSSMEVYGELESDRGLTNESDLGYVDILRPRSSYQTGKRIAESYCSYYAQEYHVPAKIARLSQVIASNIPYDESRVMAYFARCVVEGKDIVLNTPAKDVRSYCYMTDAIGAILTILIKGQDGEAYNVANKYATMKVREVAQKIIDKYSSVKLIFDIKADGIYPTSANWALATDKLESLGWEAETSLDEMLNNLINSFKEQIICQQGE